MLPDIQFDVHLGGNFWKVTINGSPSWLVATKEEIEEYKHRRSQQRGE